MALEGSLTDFGLADILQLIYFQRKTGILTLKGKMDQVKLLFVDGNIVGAESKRRLADNRLGIILLKKGHINQADLKTALDEQRNTGGKLGDILINHDFVDREAIREILQNQITETVIQSFGWKQGTYEFVAQGVPQGEFAFAIDTQHILMEGLRIVDEWSVIKGRLTLETVFIKRLDSPSGLTPDEAEIFVYIDGENDVSTIVDLTGKDNFEVSKILLTLMEKGVVEAVQSAPLITAVTEEKKKPFVVPNFLPLVTIIISLIISIYFVSTQQLVDIKGLRAAGNIEELRFKIEAYRLEHSAYPPTLDLISQAGDPWGRPYIYSVTDRSFYLASAGADGKEGTPDDLY